MSSAFEFLVMSASNSIDETIETTLEIILQYKQNTYSLYSICSDDGLQ